MSSVGFRDWRPGARSGEEPPVWSSMKPSHAANDNLIDRTHKVWQPRTGRNLTDEDARQIAANITGFFAILAEWSRAEMRVPANHNGASRDTIDSKKEGQPIAGADRGGRGHD